MQALFQLRGRTLWSKCVQECTSGLNESLRECTILDVVGRDSTMMIDFSQPDDLL